MKQDSTELAEREGAGVVGVEDPFAVDLFASGRAAAAAPADAAAQTSADARPLSLAGRARPAWHDALPAVSREEARRSASLAALPASLSEEAREAVARVLARLAQVPAGEIELEAVELREARALEFAPGGDSVAPRLFVVVGVEPEGGRVAVALEAQSASAVADRLLGGEGATPASLRPVSATERTLVEFLALAVVRELNVIAGEPLFRVEAVTEAFAPALHVGGGDDGAARVLVATVRVALGARSTLLARLVFDDTALSSLGVAANPLLARRGRAGGAEGRAAAFGRFASDAPLRLRLGETNISALDLAALEAGDIVIVSRPLVNWDGRGFDGLVSLLAGAGSGFVVTAAARRGEGVAGGAGAEGGSLAVAVESVAARAARGAAGRLIVEDEARLDAEGAGGDDAAAALEGLMLTLRVELPAGRISLEELSRLRAGQILELGCRPTDPVDLVADGRRVAAGELVDIEGGLGVRVTRVT